MVEITPKSQAEANEWRQAYEYASRNVKIPLSQFPSGIAEKILTLKEMGVTSPREQLQLQAYAQAKFKQPAQTPTTPAPTTITPATSAYQKLTLAEQVRIAGEKAGNVLRGRAIWIPEEGRFTGQAPPSKTIPKPLPVQPGVPVIDVSPAPSGYQKVYGGTQQLVLTQPRVTSQEAQAIQIEQQKTLIERQQPTLYQKQVSTYDGVPIYQTYYKDETGERIATEQDIKDFGYESKEQLLRSQYSYGEQQAEKSKLDKVREFLSQQRAQVSAQTARGKGTIIATGAGLALGAGVSVMGGVQFIKSLTSDPIETIKDIPYSISSGMKFVSSGALARTLWQEPAFSTGYIAGEIGQAYAGGKLMKTINRGFGKIIQETSFVKKAVQVEKDIQLAEEVKPYSRQRATLILQEEKTGAYVLGKTSSGEAISFGGKIEAGEYPLEAALRELREETGLSKKDITDIKKVKDFTFPEETFYTYKAKVKDITKIKPSSDITELRIVKPKEVRGVAGMTLRNPIEIKGIRSYEAGIINFMETGKEPTWLKVETKLGEFYLGTQSRYDIPASKQLKYLEQDKLLLAHGTTKPAISEKWFSLFEKEMKIDVGESKRGTPGLYLQPPIEPRRGITKLRGYSGKGIKLSSKEILKLPFETPKAPGYLGLSYAGFGPDILEDLGLKFGREKPTFYIFEESGKLISPTKKTLLGIESEFIIEPRKYIRTKGAAEIRYIGGKRVRFQPTEIVSGKEALIIKELRTKLTKDIGLEEKKTTLRRLKAITGIDYSKLIGKYTYISPEEVLAKTIRLKDYDIQKSIEEKKVSLQFQESLLEPVYKSEKVTKYSYKEPISIYPYKRIQKKAYKIIYREPKSYAYRKIREPYKPIYEPPTKIVSPLIPSEKKSRRKEIRSLRNILGFNVFKLRRGIKTYLGKGLTKYSALDLGTKSTFKDLTATFGIEKSSLGARDLDIEPYFEKYKSKFRRPVPRSRLKRFGSDLFVQKQTGRGGRLSTAGEIAEIKQSKRKMEKYLT